MTGHPTPDRLARADSLAGDERAALLRHVQACAACRAAWIADDPANIFALLRLDSPAGDALEGLSARLGVAVTGSRSARRLRAVAALAAALLLAALLGLRLGPSRQPAASVTLESRAEAPFRPSALAPETSPAEIELISSPGSAQVLGLTVGDTQLVMIFDKDLDI